MVEATVSFGASFVIPAYNEEKAIEAVLSSMDLTMRKIKHEIIVVDDGSKDNTYSKAVEYANRNCNVKVVSYPLNMGKGYALKKGFIEASSDIVVFTDGDLEVDLNTVSSYMDALVNGDIVIASKWHPDSEVQMPLVRRILSRSFNVLVRLLTGVPLKDTQAGLKAMRRSAFIDIFPHLSVKRYAFDAELLAAAQSRGLKIVEMPVNIKMNASFKPKDIYKMFIDLLGIAYRLRILHWYQRPLTIKGPSQLPINSNDAVQDEKQFVSIIIPCKTIDAYTKECIEQCQKLDYKYHEIIVLPDSADEQIEGTMTIPTGPVSPGLKRNIGVKNASGNYCAFIDNDAYPRKDWLTNALKHFKDPQVGGVGGPGLTPAEDGSLQKAGGYVMSSFMTGNLSSRYKTKGSFESDDIHSCNFVASKEAIKAAGGWNEKYWPGEDTLMCMAIKGIGKKLVESSDVVVYHHRRSLLKAHLKQVSRFGIHRGFFAKKYPKNSLKPTYFLPTILVSGLFGGILLAMFFPALANVVWIGAGAYLFSALVASVLQVRSLKMVFQVWAGIVVTHFVYGLYFLSGLLKRDLKR